MNVARSRSRPKCGRTPTRAPLHGQLCSQFGMKRIITASRMTSQHQPGMSIAAAMAEAAQLLRASGSGDARRDAATLLMHTLNCDRAFLITHAEDVLAPDALAQFRLCIERRVQGEPLQYITGRQEFYGLEFEVTPDVL